MHIKFAPIPPCDCLGMASLWAIPPPRSGINPHSPAGWANPWANSQQASYFEFLPLQPYLIMQAEIPFGGIVSVTSLIYGEVVTFSHGKGACGVWGDGLRF